MSQVGPPVSGIFPALDMVVKSLLACFLVYKVVVMLRSKSKRDGAPIVEEVGTWKQLDAGEESVVMSFTPTRRRNSSGARKKKSFPGQGLKVSSGGGGGGGGGGDNGGVDAFGTIGTSGGAGSQPGTPTSGRGRGKEGGTFATPQRQARSSSGDLSQFNWIFFSPQKPQSRATNSGGHAPFKDYGDNLCDSPTLQNRDPYLSSRLMRKHLLSLIPMLRQATLHESLTKLFLVAQEKDHSALMGSGASPRLSKREEANVRAKKAHLMMMSLFAAFEDELKMGMPLPRSSTTASIGIEQALKDACRERIAINGVEIKYENPASVAPDMAAGELTERLCEGVEICSGRKDRETVGRLVGRILGALCRTGSGGDTYCAVNALFDIAGTQQKTRGLGLDDDEEEAVVFPFLIMPANVLGDSDKALGGDVDIPGPLRLAFKKNGTAGGGGPVAEIVTTSLLDVHLADEVMQPAAGNSAKKSKQVYRSRTENGMARPLVRLKATILEVISMESNSGNRERSLRLEAFEM
ncbi:hypothetical protein TrRE_jg1298 [Triparma retinervis]|uniref:Uncharacterized protein n=1 Tax=Triparma retinervis TaxID=2557542 RepID=A0A9W7AIV5_9STRA|nr:hypothetical protein TrRE_jg1298 [Triparma retinervis]